CRERWQWAEAIHIGTTWITQFRRAEDGNCKHLLACLAKNQAEAYTQRGLVFAGKLDHEWALEDLAKAVELREFAAGLEQAQAGKMGTAMDLAEAYLNLGSAEARGGDAHFAAASLQKAIGLLGPAVLSPNGSVKKDAHDLALHNLATAYEWVAQLLLAA